MIRARWNGEVIAEAERTIVIEGNHYFPIETVRPGALMPSPSRSLCFWKGLASYYHVAAGDKINPDAAWSYPRPSPFARRIKNHVAFWQGVTVSRD
ncbi:MAG: DUF427 domain-containing protein [Candidatus Dormibacteria bacterium]